ncbi:MAG: cell division protein FtsL [Lysobacterales bacterium]
MKPLQVIFVLMLAAVVGSAIALVYARHQNRTLFFALEKLNAERDELNIEWGQLQLEQSTWADANRVEQIATRDLGMTFPAPQDIVVIAP